MDSFKNMVYYNNIRYKKFSENVLLWKMNKEDNNKIGLLIIYLFAKEHKIYSTKNKLRYIIL